MTFGAAWGGIPCSLDPRSPPRYVRARGLEASVSSVSFPRSVFLDAIVPLFEGNRLGERGADDVSALIATMNAKAPQAFLRVQRPPYVGDLVFVQDVGGGQPPRQARARSLYFVEARAIDPETDNPLVEVTLSDVRRWWDDFGVITRSWNVPRADGYVAHTAEDGGAKPTPLRAVVADLLLALPGALPVAVWPDDELVGPDVRAWGASPKEALADLLQAYRLEIDVGHDLKARFFRGGEGAIGELEGDGGGDNDLGYDPITAQGIWRKKITAEGNGYARRPAHENPTDVVVVGGRTILDVQIDYLTAVLPYQAVDPVTLSPVEHVIEATPNNLSAFVKNTLPGLELQAPTGAVSTFADLSGQLRLDKVRGEVEPAPKTTPAPTSRGVAAVLAGSILDTLDGFRDASQDNSILDTLNGFRLAPVNEDPLPVHVWQRLPGLDEQAWPAELVAIPEEKRDRLKKLWRVYQVPEPLRRFLRIRARAETDAKGKRLAPVCEAFGFRPTRVKIENPAIKAQGEARAQETRARAKLAADFEAIVAEIDRLQAIVDKLRLPTAQEIVDLVARDGDHDKTALELAAWFLIPPIPGLDGNLYRQTEGLLPVTPDEGQTATIGRILDRVGSDVLEALGLQGLAPQIAGAAEREARLKAEIAKLEARKLEIEKEIHPVAAKWQEMGVLLAQAEQERQDTGRVGASTTAAIDAKQKEINAIQAEAALKPPALPQWVEVTRLKNLGRRQVEFRVLDAERGLIELAELPCWVADENVPSLDQTFVIPMPVRLTFGTTNAVDVEERSVNEGAIPGFYAKTVAEAIKRSPQLAPFLGVTGHRIPKTAGEGQAVFSFTRADRSGAAATSRYAYRVTIDDPDFRLLVRLSGESNRAALLAQAKAIADALLDRPDEVDAGRLVMIEPRQVALNGRQSAVSIYLEPKKGAGFVTEVSFDSDLAPLGDLVEGLKRARGGLSFRFGIDVDADNE